MSPSKNMKEKGFKGVMAWIPADLHAAFMVKLRQDRVTAKEAMIYWIKRYTNYTEKAPDNETNGTEKP